MRKLPMTQLTDGGRDRIEKLDCTVRALATALDIPYWQSHQILQHCGRQDKHRTAKEIVDNAYNLVGFNRVDCWDTLGKFIQSHAIGVYICRMRGHVFAVKDSVVYDNSFIGLRTRILNIWTR